MSSLNRWNETRDIFNDWTVETAFRKVFEDKASFEGISTWWCSSIMKRDSIDSNLWLIELDKKLRRDLSSENHTSLRFIPRGWLRNFLTDLILHLYRYCAIKPSTFLRKDIKTLFICNEYNLSKSANKVVDKNYAEVPTSGRNEGRIGFAIVPTEICIKPALFFKYRQKWKERQNLENYDVYLTSSRSSIRTIIDVYMWSIKSYWAIRKICNSNQLDLMSITEIDCSVVLNPLLEDSFSNQIPRNIIYGLAMVQIADDVLDDGSVVTYGEMISETLFFYALLRLKLPLVKIIVIQHSLIFENKMQMIMHPDSFIPRSRNRFESAQMPDMYLLQGEQAKRIVARFVPEDRIKIIGSLKSGTNLVRNSSLDCNKSYINIVVALSLGDEFYVLDCIRDLLTISNYKWTVCFHPAVSLKVKNQLIHSIASSHALVEIYSGKTTDKFDTADVVISGYSAVGIEALRHGIDTIRVANVGLPPTIDDDFRVPCVSSASELSILLSRKCGGEKLIEDKN